MQGLARRLLPLSLFLSCDMLLWCIIVVLERMGRGCFFRGVHHLLGLLQIVFSPSTVVEHLIFNFLFKLCLLTPLDVFLDGLLHAFSKLILRLLARLGILNWLFWSLSCQPRFILLRETASHTAQFATRLTDARFECALKRSFFEFYRVLVSVLAIEYFSLSNLVH